MIRITISPVMLAMSLLTACASAPPVAREVQLPPLPRQLIVHTIDASQQAESALLVVQQDTPDTTRWLLLDPLGIPIARQILHDGRFTNDGFLPPNAVATDLFAALVFSWTPRSQLAKMYPSMDAEEHVNADGSIMRRLSRNGRVRWSVLFANRSEADKLRIMSPRQCWTLRPANGTEQFPAEPSHACLAK